MYVVEALSDVTAVALDLLARHPLRAGDAVQLASCLRLRQRLSIAVQFVAYDDRLLKAAQLEGVAILASRPR